MSSIPKNKEELYHAISEAYEKLIVDYSKIPEENTRSLNVEGNTKNTPISVCDTLSYLIGWGKLVLKWHDRKSNALAVDFPDTGFKWNELGKLAQHFHTRGKEKSYAELLLEYKSTVDEILILVDSLNEQELYGNDWYKKYTLGRMIQFNTSSPMKNVRTKIRKFIKTMNKQ